MNEILIQRHPVGPDHPVFIIAELSANHLQKFELAKDLVHAAASSGVDAVKLQTYTPETITLDSDRECFQIRQGTLWDGQSLFDLYKKAYAPWEWQPRLKKLAEDLGLLCFSSPFDPTAVDFLEEMNVPAYKVASFEITDLPLIEYIASRGKPVLMSTGIATEEEIAEAVATCRRAGNDDVILLKCTSAYPARYEDANLRTIPDMARRFGVIGGLSDHTPGIAVPVAATALGACVIEKHLTLSRSLGGPDAAFSLEPDEFSDMVRAVRAAEKAVGRVSYELSDQARKNRAFTRSLFAVEDIEPGEPITEKNVRSIRPGDGLAPKFYAHVLGHLAKSRIERGTPLSWDLLRSELRTTARTSPG